MILLLTIVFLVGTAFGVVISKDVLKLLKKK